jgi:hypothetical protein
MTLPADHLPLFAVAMPLRSSSAAAALADSEQRLESTGRSRSAKSLAFFNVAAAPLALVSAVAAALSS